MHWFTLAVLVLFFVVALYNFLYFDKLDKKEDVEKWNKPAHYVNLGALVVSVLALGYWGWHVYYDGKLPAFGKMSSMQYAYSPFDF